MAIVGFPPHKYPWEEKEGKRIDWRKKKEIASSFQRGVEKARVWPQGLVNVGSHFMVRNYRRGWAEGVWESEFSRGPKAPISS